MEAIKRKKNSVEEYLTSLTTDSTVSFGILENNSTKNETFFHDKTLFKIPITNTSVVIFENEVPWIWAFINSRQKQALMCLIASVAIGVALLFIILSCFLCWKWRKAVKKGNFRVSEYENSNEELLRKPKNNSKIYKLTGKDKKDSQNEIISSCRITPIQINSEPTNSIIRYDLKNEKKYPKKDKNNNLTGQIKNSSPFPPSLSEWLNSENSKRESEQPILPPTSPPIATVDYLFNHSSVTPTRDSEQLPLQQTIIQPNSFLQQTPPSSHASDSSHLPLNSSHLHSNPSPSPYQNFSRQNPPVFSAPSESPWPTRNSQIK